MSNDNFSRLEEERKRLRNEFEEEARHRIETAIALAKVEWFAVSMSRISSEQRQKRTATLWLPGV